MTWRKKRHVGEVSHICLDPWAKPVNETSGQRLCLCEKHTFPEHLPFQIPKISSTSRKFLDKTLTS